MLLHPDRLFPADPTLRQLARRLCVSAQSLPIISPHGHTQAAWFAANTPLPDNARHDAARRVDSAFLARLVAEHRLDEDEAFDLAREPAYGLVKKAYQLQGAKDGAGIGPLHAARRGSDWRTEIETE
jgi:glucuronate isomerase